MVNLLEALAHGAVMPVGTRCANVAIFELVRHLALALVTRIFQCRKERRSSHSCSLVDIETYTWPVACIRGAPVQHALQGVGIIQKLEEARLAETFHQHLLQRQTQSRINLHS